MPLRDIKPMLKKVTTTSDSVQNSRAGDRFHYLWAARRCLQMIHPLSPVRAITIEGSPEPNAAGELVIDVGEVRTHQSGAESVHYYQLKHSTVRVEKPTPLSELEKTLSGFAARFAAKPAKGKPAYKSRSFWFISNRPVSDSVKQAVGLIANGKKPISNTAKRLATITGLAHSELQRFCASLQFSDQEGDYTEQERELRSEISRYDSGTLEDSATLKLLGLVSGQALPTPKGARKRGVINREQVLRVLGVNHPDDLFPAPSAMESVTKAFLREQHKELVRQIVKATDQVIIHAAGGVGKSVVAQQLAASFPKGSVAFVYDCYGGGNYMNQSKPRHRPCDALMQMANEMAVMGLCQTMIAGLQTPVDCLLRSFLNRLDEASAVIRQRSPRALLVLLVDAADNAEMAAEAFGDRCFAGMLIRERLPQNCRLVFLCRTERRKLLNPPSRVLSIPLKAFSPSETARLLKRHFPKSSQREAKEFHRLTGGNPRVQANCLGFAKGNAREMLDTLSPGRTTVDQQIGNLLRAAINRLRDENPEVVGKQIEAICRGLATLPPFIPIPVLAAAADVEPAAIKSFIAELGRPLWSSDESVQFRDEPTETWFKQEFAASSADVRLYAEALEPLAADFTYAARSLPALWHQAGEHAKLIRLALSDEFLPLDSPIDARDVRVYRLQYALKAALKVGLMADAAKLSLRAGEEMAGNQRQLGLLQRNVDLMAALQAPHLVQECAYKRQLRSGWRGSENVFAASLLASHKDFHGEASNYLHAADHWLQIHFAERDAEQKKSPHRGHDALTTSDIAEFGWAVLGLSGPKRFSEYISRWSPAHTIYEATHIVVRRLIDAGRFDAIDAIARSGARCAHLVVALCGELAEVSRFPPRNALEWTLGRLADGTVQIGKQPVHAFQDSVPQSIVSFAEACAHHGLPRAKILNVLEQGSTLVPALHTLASDYDKRSRHAFARAVTLSAVLKGVPPPAVKALVPDARPDVKEHDHAREERGDSRRILETLLPLYEARAKIITRQAGWESITLRSVESPPDSIPSSYDYGSRSRIDGFWDELPAERLRLLALHSKAVPEDIAIIVQALKAPSAPWRTLEQRIRMTRIAYRHDHLRDLGVAAEKASYAMMEAAKSPEPDERVSWSIMMARAVLTQSKADAAAYFDEAIEEVSKFADDEVTQRWDAISTLARASAKDNAAGPEVAYRYARCSELVGISVGREKHWDRPDVFRVLAQLHAPSAYTALSRWREREVGHFPYLIEALGKEAVANGSVSAGAGFSLTGFVGVHGSVGYLANCLEREPLHSARQMMFDRTVADLYLEGELLQEKRRLLSLVTEKQLDPERLTTFCERAERALTRPVRKESYDEPRRTLAANPPEDRLAPLLRGLYLASVPGLTRAVMAARTMDPPREFEVFWAQVLDHIAPGSEVEFLRVLLEVQQVSYYDFTYVVSIAKDRWLSKASVRREWPAFLKGVGKRLYCGLSERGGTSYWQERCHLDQAELAQLQTGVHEGIQLAPALLQSSALFGYASLLAERLLPSEARGVLDYALHRLEQHLPPDFGDGPWADWLASPLKALDSYTGMIWAALGAPDSSTRWEAAHCVRRLVEFGCQDEIASLLGWIGASGTAAFLGKGFPFYELHAQLWLFFGLARGSLKDAKVLSQHSEAFVRLALAEHPHAMIQMEAAKIALSIEQSAPGIFSREIMEQLQQVGRSQLSPRVSESNHFFESPWHGDKSKQWPKQPGFGMDIDAYWIPALAGVFNLSPKVVDDLMREVTIERLGVPSDETYVNDPRRSVWNSFHSGERSTYHSHGSYPSVHDYHFYYSYHSMMIVAARLLRTMPVAKRDRDWELEDYDPWSDWIASHQLTRRDGRWLADRRDPTLPARQPRQYSDQWLWGVMAEDFVDVLTAQASIPGGLCVGGSWSDVENDNDEHVRITSAFVRQHAATSLANALRNIEAPGCCRLESLLDDRDQQGKEPFDLIRLITHGDHHDPRQDSFDPHANSLYYPPRTVSPDIAEQFGLQTDEEQRFWRVPKGQAPSIACEAWCDERPFRSDSQYRSGERVFASLEFLMHACATLHRFLVISVEIRRHSRHRRLSDDSYTYQPPSWKAFILDSNGLLRDARAHHHLGQATGCLDGQRS